MVFHWYSYIWQYRPVAFGYCQRRSIIGRAISVYLSLTLHQLGLFYLNQALKRLYAFMSLSSVAIHKYLYPLGRGSHLFIGRCILLVKLINNLWNVHYFLYKIISVWRAKLSVSSAVTCNYKFGTVWIELSILLRYFLIVLYEALYQRH